MQNHIKIVETISKPKGFDCPASDFAVYLVTADGKEAVLQKFHGLSRSGIRYRNDVLKEATAYVKSIAAIADPDVLWITK
jgi:hypothetical protein